MDRRQFIKGVFAAMAGLVWGLSGKTHRAVAQDSKSIDDTTLLQTALNRGGNITLEAGRRYRLVAPPGARAALTINSNTFLDLAGAMLELAPGQHCALIATPPGGKTRNIRIANGEIIGNGTLQPQIVIPDPLPQNFDFWGWYTPTLYFVNCDGLELRNLRLRDTYQFSLYAYGNDGTVDNVSVEGAIGQGLQIQGARWQIDRVNVRDVIYVSLPAFLGNPFIVNLRDSTVGSVQCENYGFGIKFQDGCENVTVLSIVAVGGTNNTLDYLVKIQGKKSPNITAPNRGMRIGSIVARNGPASGLYIYYSDGVEIGSYQGENNCRMQQLDNRNAADVLILEADHVHFGTLRVQGYRWHGLWLDDKVGQVSVDTLEIGGPKDISTNPIVIRSGSVVMGGPRMQNSVP